MIWFSDIFNGEITIFDISGKMIFKQQMNSNCLNISSLREGIYIVQFQEQDKILTKKVIVEH